jgi:hypothetical protein
VLKLSWFNWYFGASWLLMNVWTIYAAAVSRKDKASAAVSAWAIINIQTLLLFTYYRCAQAAGRLRRLPPQAPRPAGELRAAPRASGGGGSQGASQLCVGALSQLVTRGCVECSAARPPACAGTASSWRSATW